MAIIQHQVDLNDQEKDFSVVPAGKYKVIIQADEYKETKKGTGMALNIQYQIVEGPFKGQILFEALNLENVSDQAVQIARRSLNSIAAAVGFPDGSEIRDTAQLHGIPFFVEVTIQDDPGYGQKNKIKKHFPEDGELKQASAAVKTTGAGTPTAKPKKPWDKK